MTGAGQPSTTHDNGAENELRRWMALYANLRIGDPSWAHSSIADLTATHGTYHDPSPWTRADEQQPGRCFEVATLWAERAGWTYIEGFALAPSAWPFPVFEHAWCLTADGLVADPALPDGTATGYFGIALSDAYRREQQSNRGTNAVFASDPANPLAGINEQALREGLPPSALAPRTTNPPPIR
ncbi:hypothetical protein [Streptomyces zhihengii]|uniref:Transglutaminase-like domain-containing protein n=1 Tax=Streptomyces zhihengii TaxID=1818004 RepID=A0ABS2V523_9ACTN|nr:hypothetical protein [Streptomyces zhihengii]MBM9624438.1 hypothetical protein [Streptomyces zhihengii]